MSIIFETYFLDFCLIPTFLVIIVIIQYVMSFSYWKSKNIPFISPKFPFGSVHLVPNEKFNSPKWFAEMYKATRLLNEKYIGLFIFTKPILVVADPDMIQSILDKDAKYFQEHGSNLDDIAHNFTKGKGNLCQFEELNVMFKLALKYCEGFEDLIKNCVSQDEPLDMINIFEKLRIINWSFSMSDYMPDIRESCTKFYSTVPTVLNYCLFELAQNEIIQNKVRDEIITTLYKYNNQISYDSLIDMKYLDQTIYETLRKYPPVPLLKREFKENYTFPGTNVAIQKGIQLWIPILGLQNDIWHYSEPYQFNPDRFTKEEQSKRHPFSYLPFGNDPRLCVGLKLSLVQLKVPLIILLKKHSYSLDPIMKLPSKLIKTGAFPTVTSRIFFRVKSI